MMAIAMDSELRPEPAAPSMTLQEALLMAYFSAGVLGFYVVMQASLSLLFGRANPPLKLIIEPYLLCLGLILHVHWRKVTRSFAEHETPRPRWIAVADAVSFMTTFWATWGLVEAFLQQAKLI